MTEPIRVGVVGLGFGVAHLAAYRELADHFTVAAVCDPVGSKLDQVRRGFGVERVFTSFDDLIDATGSDGYGAIDVLDICAPPFLHLEMIERSLEAGLHVICEKPLADSLASVDRIERMASEAGRTVMPIFQYRFGDGAARLRRLAERGVLGRAYLATAETFWRRDASYYANEWRGRWETEFGGVCAIHAIHAHDLLIDLLGPVRSVAAHTATRVNDIETEDCAAASVEFESGALATLAATLGSAREHTRLRLAFEEAAVESSLVAGAPASEPWTIEPVSAEAAERIDDALAGFVPGRALLPGQFAAFHRSLIDGAAPPVTIADARRAIELLTAIYWSARTRQVVELPIVTAHPAYAGW